MAPHRQGGAGRGCRVPSAIVDDEQQSASVTHAPSDDSSVGNDGPANDLIDCSDNDKDDTVHDYQDDL
jgi:hypothetical protein